LGQLQKVAIVSPGDNGDDSVIIPPKVMAQAIKAIRDDWNFQHKKWATPYSAGFVELLELTAAQITGGTMPILGASAWSGALA
jgi:hypothetical protein